ncbi:phosphogluconate dehydratase [Microlunatus elymi]|uniref:Phosphogluconate dehydratase n=1 Tax=Microlunatus elymi TaxID=2596828 RepID=A0A516Q4F1_9ACTN|nr:phosphogluconate dehydratase [Microlunatus elymi]
MTSSVHHPVLAAVTQRVIDRSRLERSAYLDRIDRAADREPARARLACANLAHGFAAAGPADKEALRATMKPNVAIVSAYNDMLSAHQPFETYPARLKKQVLRSGGIAQFAGGVPAMCDGITQGRDGMQLSLFSRDVIAMSTAIALSHDMFDAALMLGVCDKIVPGLLIGALSFGHLPTIFVPAGPMTSGLPNSEKSRIRQAYAAGEVGREELLAAEAASYHSAGTCTFYGTANSNQLLMEVLGLHLPGSSFVNPGTPLRDAFTDAAAARSVAISGLARRGADGSAANEFTPIGRVVDEKSIMNAAVALLATGGSTNHTVHLVAIARAAGITLTWDDLSELSEIVPLLARVYPNGAADVNHFHAAGGLAFTIGTLLDAGLLHEDVQTVAGPGLRRYTREARLIDGRLAYLDGPAESHDRDVLRGVDDPFAADGGLKMLSGNLGRAVIKTSAVADRQRTITAPARVFDDQAQFLAAFEAGELTGDLVAAIRFQGPAANGMPELHKLTPPLGVLQDRGQRVALVTDGRMSGASGKIPAAIHLTPEASAGGALARLRDGDLVTLNSLTGRLEVHVSDDKLAARTPAVAPAAEVYGTGRELFGAFRAQVGPADTGASVLFASSARADATGGEVRTSGWIDSTPEFQPVRAIQPDVLATVRPVPGADEPRLIGQHDGLDAVANPELGQ